MTLEQTTQTILKWVTSCDTQEQLDLLTEIVETFIIARFQDADKTEKIFSIVTITTAIETQLKLVTLHSKTELPNTSPICH